MDCIHARLLIVLQGRDAHELDADGRAALEAHLEQCADCLAWSSRESRVDEALGQAIRNVPVPAALPSKILHALEQQRRPRRVPWLSAAAACLVVGLSIGGYVWYTDKPFVTVQTVHEYVSHQEIATAKDVVELFATEAGLTIEIPEQFNFENYNGSSIATWRGHKIPRLEFVNRGDGEPRAAVVYVLAKDRFNLEEIVKAVGQPPVVTSNHQIDVLRPFRDHPGFIYVVVYAGPVRPFFLRLDA